MRKLKTTDVFATMRIIKKTGMKEDLIPLIKKATAENLEDIGIEGFLTIIEILSEKNSEKAIYEVLAGPFEMTAKEVENLELDELAKLLEQLGNENNVKNFFKALSSVITSK